MRERKLKFIVQLMEALLVAQGARKAALLEFVKTSEKKIERVLEKVCNFCSYVGCESKLPYTMIKFDGITHVIVTKEKDKWLQPYLANAIKEGDKETIGFLLGYPSCCVKNYVKDPEKAVREYIRKSIRKGVAYLSAEKELGAWFVGKHRKRKEAYHYLFLPYVPCDPFCTETIYRVHNLCFALYYTLGKFIDELGEKYEIRGLSKRKKWI